MDDLIWALVLAALAAMITSLYLPTMPPALLWVAYLGFGAAVVLLMRWWLKVLR